MGMAFNATYIPAGRASPDLRRRKQAPLSSGRRLFLGQQWRSRKAGIVRMSRRPLTASRAFVCLRIRCPSCVQKRMPDASMRARATAIASRDEGRPIHVRAALTVARRVHVHAGAAGARRLLPLARYVSWARLPRFDPLAVVTPFAIAVATAFISPQPEFRCHAVLRMALRRGSTTGQPSHRISGGSRFSAWGGGHQPPGA